MDESLDHRSREILVGELFGDFLDKGVQHLKPLTLKDVAEDIEVHESTVSRVTSNKYAETPRGTFRLKYFFSNSLGNNEGTDVSVEYGTQSMANEISRLYNSGSLQQYKTLMMAGHEDGVICFGGSVDQAAMALVDLWVAAHSALG